MVFTLLLDATAGATTGEFVGGPDGCGIDLEDSSTGIVLARNYISRTYGAGIMLFAGTGPGRCAGIYLGGSVEGCLKTFQ